MPLDYGVGENSWESLGLQGNPTSSSKRKSVLNIHWKDWCWNWNCNTLSTWCKELTHWKRPWFWERLKAGGEGGSRGWDGRMVSLTRWTWVWVDSGSWWWTGRPGSCSPWGCQESDTTERLNWDTIIKEFGIAKLYTCNYVTALYGYTVVIYVLLFSYSLTCVQIFGTSWTLTHQAPLPIVIHQDKILAWVTCPPPVDLPNPGIEPRSPALEADSLPSEQPGKPKTTRVGGLSFLQGNFPSQELNQGPLNCRHILYQQTCQGSPRKKESKVSSMFRFNKINFDWSPESKLLSFTIIV